MKKMFLSAILFIGLGTMAFAQQPGKGMRKSPEQRAEKMTAVLEEKLQLSEEQKAKIYAINLENVKKRDAERRERMKTERAAMKESLQKQDEQITGILNDDQKSAFENLKKERNTERKPFRKANPDWKGKKSKQNS